MVLASPGGAAELQFAFEHGGENRQYLLYAPASYTPGTALPLVVVLHGRPSTAARMAKLTAFNQRAEANDFLVVYPQGQNSFWNYLYGLGEANSQPDDPGFVLAVLSHVMASHSVDADRIYVAGISNGGFMAQRLACEYRGVFAAFASVAATGYAYMPEECRTRGPVSMLYIHGTADGKVPWQGLSIPGDGGTRRPVTLSMMDSVKYWSARAECARDITRQRVASVAAESRTHVVRMVSRNCAENRVVELFAVMGGGHNWPGVEGVIPARIAGEVNLDIHASDVIWSFFRDKRR